MTFKSAVDWWYYLVIASVVLVLLVVLVPQVSAGEISPLVAVALAIFCLGLPVWLLLATFYRVDGDSLHVQSGPFSWRINISDIKSVTPSRSAISSPALSLNRMELTYGAGKKILVSPKNQKAFLDAIGQ